MNIIETLESKATKLAALIEIIKSTGTKLDDVKTEPTLFESGLGASVDFDYAPHDDTVKIMLAFGGKWSKELKGRKVNYVRDELYSGMRIRVWSGDPPPCCKIVKEERIVPAHMVPERVETIERLVCPEGFTVTPELSEANS